MGLGGRALRYLLCLQSCVSFAGPPLGYYDTVDPTSAATLRVTLHQIIDDHTRFPFTAAGTDTWDILESADEDPSNPANVLDLYRNASYPKLGEGNDFYNREHAWPSSYGFTNDNAGNYPYTDCHHLIIADSGYNSSRSNRPYRNLDPSADEKPTEVNTGRGGGMGVYPGNSNWVSGFIPNQGVWETWIGRRGEVARALFYMDVRYEGGLHGMTMASEPDLILTTDRSLIVSDTTNNKDVAHMGILAVLLEWHQQDPVDDIERRRNDVVFSFQGNRNPFIDHPDWVPILFKSNAGAEVWINEFHYDNTGADSGEFVEIAGRAGTDLSGYRVVGYNGGDGSDYDTANLSGLIPLEEACFGTVSVPFVGMQNGPDGLALVDSVGTVLQFISYEGSFSATAGPATGAASIDIGVSEATNTPVGQSLQLAGVGYRLSDFVWDVPEISTPGTVNEHQVFAGGCIQATPTGLLFR